MSLASVVQNDHFELGFVRSIDSDGGKAQQLVELNGAYRTRNLDMKGMGGNAQVNNLGLMTMLANKKVLSLCGEIVSYEDIRTREQQLKIDMVRAFGSEIAAMGDMVAAVMEALAEGSSLSPEQKEQLLATMDEMITLKNLTNMGAIEGGEQKLEAMIAQVAEKLADLLIDGLDQAILPQALADFARNFLHDVAQDYDLPEIDAKIIQIDRMMDPQIGLREAVAEVIQTLTERLESDDLDEEERAEIESVLEKLQDAMEKDAPIPNSIIKALDDLIAQYPNIAQESGIITQILDLKIANSEVKTALMASVDRAMPIDASVEKAEKVGQTLSLKESVMGLVAANSNIPRVENTIAPVASTLSTPSVETPVIVPVVSGATPTTTPSVVDQSTPSTPTQDIAVGDGETPPAPETPSEPKLENPDKKPILEPEEGMKEPPRQGGAPKPDELKKPDGGDGETPEDDSKNDPKDPKRDPEPPEGQDDDVKDPLKKKCEGLCECEFNKAAANPDGTVTFELENGEKVTMSSKEANAAIEESIEKKNVDPEIWKKQVEKFDGDKTKAFEYVNNQIRQEQVNIGTAQEKFGKIETENKQLDDSIRQAREALKSGTSHSTSPQGNGGAKTQFGHVCGPNCDHGQNNTTDAKNEIKSSGFKSKKGGKTPTLNNA